MGGGTAAPGAELEILMEVVEIVAARMGVEEIGGMPLEEWFDRSEPLGVADLLGALEELHPDMAARMQILRGRPERRNEEPKFGADLARQSRI
ncbi:hypothetical protein BH23VER1_BH23VER1_17190 [soil metagenome]